MDLDPFGRTYLTDPASVWKILRDISGPVGYADDIGMWLIIGYSAVRQAFADSASFANTSTLAPVYEMCPEALSIVSRIDVPPTTAAADPPTHPRTRAVLRAAFGSTPKSAAEQYGAIVRARVDELVAQLPRHTEHTVDLVSDFAAVLPLRVIVDILGIPTDDIPLIKRWSDGQIALVWGSPRPEEQVELAKNLLEFWHYCRSLVAERIADADPGTDFISQALRHRGNDDSVVTLEEIASLAFNLLVAGHETTSGLLAHALDQALSVPQRWDRLAGRPQSIAEFVGETLRFAPPIDGWLRVTTTDVTIGTTTIPRGARCLLLIGTANRDESIFPHPDSFDHHRHALRDNLSFGFGSHYCVGAALARLEAETTLYALTRTFPHMRLGSEYVRSFLPNLAFRAHCSLPVTLGPQA